MANCVGSIVLKSAHTTTDVEFDQVSLNTPVMGVCERFSLGLCAYGPVPTVGDPTPLGGRGVLLVTNKGYAKTGTRFTVVQLAAAVSEQIAAQQTR